MLRSREGDSKVKENVDSLKTRLQLHQRLGANNFEKWLIEFLPLNPATAVLDLGCGPGCQSRAIYEALGGKVSIVGTDVTSEFDQATRITWGNKPIIFQKMNFDWVFPFGSSQFDLILSCFSLYYARDINHTLNEIKRVMRPSGTFCAFGPMHHNKWEFKDLIADALGIVMEPNTFSGSVLEAICDSFKSVLIKTFRNPMTFKTIESFMKYAKAALDPSREVYDFEADFEMLEAYANDFIFKNNNEFTITKVVGGVTAWDATS